MNDPAVPTPMPTNDELIAALRGVDDPELGINIVDLGLVVDTRVAADRIEVDLAMTSPSCPMGDLLVDDSTEALRAIAPQAADIAVRLVGQPVWTPQRMSAAARVQFGW